MIEPLDLKMGGWKISDEYLDRPPQGGGEAVRKPILVGERPGEVPATCPVTGLRFFTMVYAMDDDEHGGLVPTYGGPFDSYTIPTQDNNGDWIRNHYDHDEGGWADPEVLSEYDLLPHLREQNGGADHD